MNNSHGIVKTFDEYDFINEFKAYDRMDNFTRHGLRVLFNSLEEMANDCGMNIEMDVIALCCDYNELSADDVINEYNIDLDNNDYDHIDDASERKNQLAQDYLNDNTMLIDFYEIDDITYFLFQAF